MGESSSRSFSFRNPKNYPRDRPSFGGDFRGTLRRGPRARPQPSKGRPPARHEKEKRGARKRRLRYLQRELRPPFLASPALIRRLRDAIRPIYRPRYGEARELPWLRGDDLVLGYAAGGEAFAYPIKVLNFWEIVNDVIAGEPVLVTYCPLCGSAAVFSRRLGGRVFLFGNTSALYESDMVMFDYETGSYWFQVMGRAIVGAMTGVELTSLPSATLAWEDWKKLHPATRLLVGDARGGFAGRSQRDPFSGYAQRLNRGRFAFPVSKDKLDRRLSAGEAVITTEVGGAIKAYPLRLIGDRAVNDTLAGRRIAVFSRTSSGAVFLARASGKNLRFAFKDGKFRDEETGSAWNLAGIATSGPLKGKRLKPLPGRRAFWFSIAGAVPGIELYMP